MYRRVPASEIIHLYLDERIDQSRGVPWLVASLKPLRMLAGYQEAELVAARTASAKMGFFTKETPEGMTGEEDAKGNLTMDATPGVIEELPPGVKFQSWDPSHPGNNYSGFVKGALRGVASSLGVSYNTLASDLEGVNYSSIRAGLLEEREVWKAVQRFLVENMAEPIFTEWLWVELLSGRIPLPPEKFDKFNAPEFRPRRWSWVDPKKDMEAHILAIGAGLTSRRAAIAEGGGDVWDTFADIAADSALAAQFKIALADLRGGNSGSVDKPDDPEDDE
jgi:lambda family phage portal protein